MALISLQDCREYFIAGFLLFFLLFKHFRQYTVCASGFQVRNAKCYDETGSIATILKNSESLITFPKVS